MDKLEKVEKIRAKTGVSYEEAKNALEENGWDVLNALVWLEKRSAAAGTAGAGYTAQAQAQPQADTTSAEMSQAQSDYEQASKGPDFMALFNRFVAWIKRVLKKSIDTSFIADHNGKQTFSIPVLLLVILTIFAFWVVIPLLIIGLFCNFRYHFEGIGAVVIDVNDVADKMAGSAEAIKQEFVNAEKRTTPTDDSANKNTDQNN